MGFPTQCAQVRRHLESGRGLSSMQAFELYGITRLSARIYDLRSEGLSIRNRAKTGTTRSGGRCRYDEYYMEVKSDER